MSSNNLEQTGSIKIDGEDINNLGLDFVRKNLSVIPQSSFIFKGSLKFNIDPMGTSSQSEIIRILKKYEIYDVFITDKEGNDTQIKSNSGVNLLFNK